MSTDDRRWEQLAEAFTKAKELGVSDEEIVEGYVRALDETAPEVVARLRERAPQMLAEHAADRAAFEERLHDRWGDALDRFYEVVVCSQEFGANFTEKHMEEAGAENDLAFEVLSRNHARACLTALEVWTLLRAGYPTGAHARWRLLHELAVVCTVIGSHRHVPDLAERYLLHEVVVSAKDARIYQATCSDFGYEPLSDEEFNSLQTHETKLVARFGKTFKNEWGWAAPLFQGKPRFSLLEKTASLGHLQGFHRWASHGVHAGAKGAALNVMQRGPQGFNLAGPRNSGLADPGHGALISLHQVTVAFLFNGRPATGDPDDLLATKALGILVDDAGAAFLAAHAQLEKDEAAIWAEGSDASDEQRGP
ncbi:MAG TPA: DUF5677 domain-containing protein [Acidimicrobiales bacterium]|nr:DUF5677 domain-containing protein [Acidimicrobiales bacterium]